MRRDRTADVGRFRGAVTRIMGLQFDDGKQAFLAAVLDRRLASSRLDADVYLDRLAAGIDAGEVASLALELTVPETYFFRHTAQFRALTGRALPDRVAANRSERRLRLLSAGCASGEEAYSLAMAARDVVPTGWETSVRGIDVNTAMIEKARRGSYTDWALRETTPALEQRWFSRRGRQCEVDPAVRAAVRFDVRNLMTDDAEIWAPGSYDIVFLRNVLMYFEPSQARAVMARVERALRPGGFLFLGHAETLRGLSTAFNLRHTDDAFYYQRHDGSPETVRAWDEPASSPAVASPAVALSPDVGAETWIDVVHRTTARIERLAEPAPPRLKAATLSVAAPSTPGRLAWDLASVRACLHDERYADAAEALGALPPDAATDPDVLLHVAIVETHRGRLPEAESACARLLAADPFNAGAHYVLALCCEAGREPARAEHHDQVAIYLDPAFAMAHVHLGLLARRRGERGVARRTLEQAATLLQRESEARLLLFGGGFGRESLIALCRTEIGGLGRPA